jgi:hypothetical protein
MKILIYAFCIITTIIVLPVAAVLELLDRTNGSE